jgi:hypothetical protein
MPRSSQSASKECLTSKRSTETHSLARKATVKNFHHFICRHIYIHVLFHPQICPTWQPTQFTLISALHFSDTVPIIAPPCQREICKCTRGVEFQYTSTCRTTCITLHCILSHHSDCGSPPDLKIIAELHMSFNH